MLQWIVTNWWCSIPIGAAAVYLLCSVWESAAYKKLGIKTGDTAAEAIDAAGKTTLKVSMLVIPLIMIIVGYFIYRAKYKIDEKMYKEMVADLKMRGDIKE